jgi:hypothetical protein
MAGSPSEADEPKPNKSITQAEVQLASLPHVGVEDIFFLAVLTLVGEVFLALLSPEDYATNFLLVFKGLARASSCVDC